MTIDWPSFEASNAPLNAFIDSDRKAASGQGPLADLTVGIKSNIAVKGLPWTAGLGHRRHVIAERDAAVVARLREAGAAILGTLNMHEAALGATTDNPWFGRTHNPHRPGYSPGGSSGGSAAAVAAGLCDAALGTDTLGSIRIPAAYCGVYGLKPTWDAVDSDGLVSLGHDYDVIGPLARTLDMIERVWRIIGTGGDAAEPFRHVVRLADLAGVDVQSDVRSAYERALSAVDLPATDLTLPASPTQLRLAALAEIARELIAALGPDRGKVSPELTFILDALEGFGPDPDLLARTRATLLEAIGADGVLVMPTAPQSAFAHSTPPPSNQADFTGLANIAGLPALAIPAGRDRDGLPVGIQLVGSPGSEDRLIALARRLEPTLGGAVLPEGVTP